VNEKTQDKPPVDQKTTKREAEESKKKTIDELDEPELPEGYK
jgi:hypothetical protein